jgi:MFS family permease
LIGSIWEGFAMCDSEGGHGTGCPPAAVAIRDAQQHIHLPIGEVVPPRDPRAKAAVTDSESAPRPEPPGDTAIDDARYGIHGPGKRNAFVLLLAFCASLGPMSSTTILPAVPSMAVDFSTDPETIALSNTVFLLAMALSAFLWGPLSDIYGRRRILITTATMFLAFSIGSALVPNIQGYYVVRFLTAFQGMALLIVGTSCIGDLYAKAERGVAMSWFLCGTLIGLALGPLLGGLVCAGRLFSLSLSLCLFVCGHVRVWVCGALALTDFWATDCPLHQLAVYLLAADRLLRSRAAAPGVFPARNDAFQADRRARGAEPNALFANYCEIGESVPVGWPVPLS